MSISRTAILFAFLMISLFLVGFVYYGEFIQWFLIKKDHIVYQTYSISGSFQPRLLFALNLTAAPLFAFLVGKTVQQKATAFGFISFCMIAAVLIRRFLLLLSINDLAVTSGEIINYSVSLDNLKVNPAMTVGLLIGYGTMYLYFKYFLSYNHAAANTGLPK